MAEAPSVETLDTLEFTSATGLSVVSGADGLAAVPMVRGHDGRWRRAHPGDGVADALLGLLATTPGTTTHGSFTVRSWTRRSATGERAMGVDQTNESVIVGDAAVVKWATHLQEGPHPAPGRIGALRAAGYGGMPTPWGLVTWRPPTGVETVVASVDGYLPGAVDGWTWAVDLITDAARSGRPAPFVTAAGEVGRVVAELHAALADTATMATAEDAARWREAALESLDTVRGLGDSSSVALVRLRSAEIADALDGFGSLAGTPIIDGHGDLHVGQVLRSQGRFVVTDFDGNPVLAAAQRILPVPASLDVASMVQSLVHAAIVADRYTVLDATALADVDEAGRAAFLAAYLSRLTELGHGGLFAPQSMYAFRTQQILREIIYAARHLPRWMYVPDAALPALLDEGAAP